MIKINEEKLARLHTADEILEKEYGAPALFDAMTERDPKK